MQTQKGEIEVEIFIPCFMDMMYPETGFNMVKILERYGCKVFYNASQTCCGQPAYNAGYFDEAKQIAEKCMVDLNRSSKRYVVGPTASCVGMLRNGYHRFFDNTLEDIKYAQWRERVFEFTEFLVDVLKVEKVEGATFPAKVTYHDSCSALRECGIKEGPRKLLKSVQGLELVEMNEVETCCGFGGTFAVKFESISSGMADQKTTNAQATGAEYLISTDTSCLMHLQAFAEKNNKTIKPIHIADVLASGW